MCFAVRLSEAFAGVVFLLCVGKEVSRVEEMEGGGIEVSSLNFAYEGLPPLFTRFNLDVSPGSRCLLVGANGSGDSSLPHLLFYPLNPKIIPQGFASFLFFLLFVTIDMQDSRSIRFDDPFLMR